MAKKKPAANLFEEPPLRSYRSVNNRYLIIDWASVSYHKMFSLNTAKNREKYGFQGPEVEIKLWRTFMIDELLKLIGLFDPMHIVFALEGPGSWRKDLIKDYYTKHATVYYDKTSYYVKSDNVAYSVQKAADGGYGVLPIEVDSFPQLESLNHKKLGELPPDKQDMLWHIYTPKGQPILPSYKGQRGSNEWPFSVDRKVWRKYKEQFAKEVAPIFRARAVDCDGAEGDDVIYASAKKFSAVSDDVIIVTHDSDMLQIHFDKVKIFDHIRENFMSVDDPQKYLDVKVLAGDDSDNIRGMSFIDTKTGKYSEKVKKRFGPGTAAKFLDKFPNVYDVANNNGWGEQYMRNRKLIDLSCTPEEVSKRLDNILSQPEPEVCGLELMEFWDVEPYYRDLMQSMRTYGYRSLIPESMAVKKMPVAMPEVRSEPDGVTFMNIPKSDGSKPTRPKLDGFTVRDVDGLETLGKLL